MKIQNGIEQDKYSKSIVFSWEDLDKYQHIMAQLNLYIDNNSDVTTNEEALEKLLDKNIEV